MDSSSQDQSESLILGNCLSCQGLVRVPSKAPSASVVQCPHCSESYQLAQILDQAVPELVIVSQPAPKADVSNADEIKIKEREAFVVPPQLSKGAKRLKRRRHRSDDGSGGLGKSREKNGETGVSSRNSDKGSSSFTEVERRSRFSKKSRRSTAKKNPVVEIMKVVFGGILAVPIAYLLVLWVFRQDPLSVGPRIGNVAPFLIPETLRKDGESNNGDSNDSDKTADDKNENDDNDSLAIPRLDPDRVLNSDLTTSK